MAGLTKGRESVAPAWGSHGGPWEPGGRLTGKKLACDLVPTLLRGNAYVGTYEETISLFVRCLK